MKLYILILLTPILCLCGCKKEYEKQHVQFLSSSFEIENHETTIQASINANCSWSVESENSEIRIYPSSGELSREISLKIPANNELNERSYRVRVISEDGTSSDHLTIIQEESYGFQAEDSLFVSCKGSTFGYNVKTSDVINSVEKPSWISIKGAMVSQPDNNSSSRSVVNYSYTLSVSPNDEGSHRTGIVTLIGNRSSFSFKVSQEAYSMDVSRDSIFVEPAATATGSFFFVKTDLDIVNIQSPNWVTLDAIKQDSGFVYNAAIDYNETGKQREGVIKLSGMGLYKEIKVAQDCYFLTIEKGSVETFEPGKSEGSVLYRSNIGSEYILSAVQELFESNNWIKLKELNKKEETGSYELFYDIEENRTGHSRSVSETLKIRGAELHLLITQKPYELQGIEIDGWEMITIDKNPVYKIKPIPEYASLDSLSLDLIEDSAWGELKEINGEKVLNLHFTQNIWHYIGLRGPNGVLWENGVFLFPSVILDESKKDMKVLVGKVIKIPYHYSLFDFSPYSVQTNNKNVVKIIDNTTLEVIGEGDAVVYVGSPYHDESEEMYVEGQHLIAELTKCSVRDSYGIRIISLEIDLYHTSMMFPDDWYISDRYGNKLIGKTGNWKIDKNHSKWTFELSVDQPNLDIDYFIQSYTFHLKGNIGNKTVQQSIPLIVTD